MVAGGTLLFFSEMARLKSLYPKTKFAVKPSLDDTVNQVLKHLGIFTILGFNSGVVPNRQDVVSWRKASSSSVEGDKIGHVIEAYGALLKEKSKLVFRAVAEAMVNVVNHAYAESRRDGLPAPAEKNWWMFCREDDDHLFIAVCDLGIGISRSLPAKYPSELVSAAVHAISRGWRSRDAMMIQAAMEVARTSTGTSGRGRGLKDMRRLADDIPGARFFLFSNSGLVEYQAGAYLRRNFRTSIMGTLAVWTVPLVGE